MTLLGYTPERRSAFFQFIYANGCPHIRVGAKKILFSEPAVIEWLARRSSNGRIAA